MLFQKEIHTTKSYDVVVCGGGFSGFAAAYAAARDGTKTILIERNFCLGGVGTQALVNHILGERKWVDDRIHTCVGGIFDKVEETLLAEQAGADYRTVSTNPTMNPHGWNRSLGLGLIFDNERMKLLLEQMLVEVGVEISYGTDIIDVIAQDGSVSGVIVHNKSGLGIIYGKRFIDATGDGDLCSMSGCDYLMGDENGGLAAASLEMHVENVDLDVLREYMQRTKDVRFKSIISDLKARGIWQFPYEIFISVLLTKPNVFMINTIRQVGIDGTDAASVTQGIIDGRRESYELLAIMRAHFPGFENASIRQIAPVMGIRETRRIQTDYTLSIQDLIEGKDFDDCIAFSGYGWDMPNPKHPSYQPYQGVTRKSPFTPIPFRCLLPVGLDNVLVIGRCIGAEREALGPVRVMAPCLAMGEAAGIASALSIQEKRSYRQLNVSELQEKIKAYGGIVGKDQIRVIP